MGSEAGNQANHRAMQGVTIVEPTGSNLPCNGHLDECGVSSTYLLKGFDLELTRPVSRSIRLNGKSTCIRLEVAYWRILERTARHQGVPVNKVLSQLDLEVQHAHGTVHNFSALVRVVAVVTLLRAAGLQL